MEAEEEFKHPLFQLELNTKHNGQSFTRYPVNASENDDFNRGRKSFLANRTAIIGAIQKSMSVTSDNCTIIL